MKKSKLFLMASVLFLIAVNSIQAQNANAILKKMDEVMYSPKDMTGKMSIILIDKAGNQKKLLN